MCSLRKISVSVLLIFFFQTASGRNPYSVSAGAAEAGMGYTCVMKPGFWPSFHNQASIAGINQISFGLNYENRFGLSELASRSAAAIIPAGKATLGALFSHFGYKDFSRRMAGVACGLALSEKISAGIQIDYFSERTLSEYSDRQSLTFETGIIFKPVENIRFGVHLFNPVPNSMRKSYLPSGVRAGAGIYLNRWLFAGAELQMSSGKSLVVKTGLEYETGKGFTFRGGFCSENTSFSFGFGYLMKNIKTDFSLATHERLGITPSVSLILQIP